MLEEIIKEKCAQLAQKHGYIFEYDTIISSTLEQDDCIVIKGGSVPIIYINRFWLLRMFAKSLDFPDNPRKQKLCFIPLTDGLDRALSKVPKMTRSLSLLTVRDAIVLRQGAKKWAIGIVPEAHNYMKDKYFEVSFEIKVIVKETITNTTITRNTDNIDDVDDIIQKSKSQIARSIKDSDEMSELRDIAELKDGITNIPKPSSIIIKEANNELKETYVY